MDKKQLKELRGLGAGGTDSDSSSSDEDNTDVVSSIIAGSTAGSALLHGGRDGSDDDSFSASSALSAMRHRAAAVAPEPVNAADARTLTLPPTLADLTMMMPLQKKDIIFKYAALMVAAAEDTTVSPEIRQIKLKTLEALQAAELIDLDRMKKRRTEKKKSLNKQRQAMLKKDTDKALSLLTKHFGRNPKFLIAEEIAERRVYDAWQKLNAAYSADLTMEGPSIIEALTNYFIAPTQSLRDYERGLRMLIQLHDIVTKSTMVNAMKVVYLYRGIEHDKRFTTNVDHCRNNLIEYDQIVAKLRANENHRELQSIVSDEVDDVQSPPIVATRRSVTVIKRIKKPTLCLLMVTRNRKVASRMGMVVAAVNPMAMVATTSLLFARSATAVLITRLKIVQMEKLLLLLLLSLQLVSTSITSPWRRRPIMLTVVEFVSSIHLVVNMKMTMTKLIVLCVKPSQSVLMKSMIVGAIPTMTCKMPMILLPPLKSLLRHLLPKLSPS